MPIVMTNYIDSHLLYATSYIENLLESHNQTNIFLGPSHTPQNTHFHNLPQQAQQKARNVAPNSSYIHILSNIDMGRAHGSL